MRKPSWTKTAPSAIQNAVCPHCRHSITIETIVQKDVAELFYGLENLKKPRRPLRAKERQREGAKIAQALIHNVLTLSAKQASRGVKPPRKKGAGGPERERVRGRAKKRREGA